MVFQVGIVDVGDVFVLLQLLCNVCGIFVLFMCVDWQGVQVVQGQIGVKCVVVYIDIIGLLGQLFGVFGRVIGYSIVDYIGMVIDDFGD